MRKHAKRDPGSEPVEHTHEGRLPLRLRPSLTKRDNGGQAIFVGIIEGQVIFGGFGAATKNAQELLWRQGSGGAALQELVMQSCAILGGEQHRVAERLRGPALMKREVVGINDLS